MATQMVQNIMEKGTDLQRISYVLCSRELQLAMASFALRCAEKSCLMFEKLSLKLYGAKTIFVCSSLL